MTTCSKLTDVINEGIENHSFGVADKSGREIGASIIFTTRIYEAIESNGWLIAPGTYYCWQGQATKNGNRWGPCQVTHHCKTEQERFEAAEKYLKDAAKRAAKK
jgi:hypothetical protein